MESYNVCSFVISIIHLKWIHVIPCLSTSFIFIVKYYQKVGHDWATELNWTDSIIWTVHILCIHSSASEHFGCFHFCILLLWIMLLWIVCTSLCGHSYIFISLCCIPIIVIELLDYMVTLMFNLEKLPDCFPKWLQHFIFPSELNESSNFTNPYQHLLLCLYFCSHFNI